MNHMTISTTSGKVIPGEDDRKYIFVIRQSNLSDIINGNIPKLVYGYTADRINDTIVNIRASKFRNFFVIKLSKSRLELDGYRTVYGNEDGTYLLGALYRSKFPVNAIVAIMRI